MSDEARGGTEETRTGTDERQTGTFTVKRGLADMLRGGVIMDVVTDEHARIARGRGCRRRDGARAGARGHPRHKAVLPG